jgi:hypothetical protein
MVNVLVLVMLAEAQQLQKLPEARLRALEPQLVQNHPPVLVVLFLLH